MNNLPALAFMAIVLSLPVFSQQSDAALRTVAERDRSSRGADGEIPTLSAAEHLHRAEVYSSNRQFPQAREHWKKIFDVYPNDPGMAAALVGTGRSYMWEREYKAAIPYFERVAREYPETKEGREGLAFNGACHVRLGKNTEAAALYERYTVMYPKGERIETSHLNIIDALREAEKYDEADAWVEKTRTKFPGQATETNALQARVRMEIFRGRWPQAEAAADLMLSRGKFSASMTSIDEIKYLKALAIEKSGNKQRAIDAYAAIPNSLTSYYGGLASTKLSEMGAKFHVPVRLPARSAAEYPVMYRADLLQYSKKHKIDPRFLLAIMKQESSFRANAKSPSAARGLLQLVFDTALKYNKKAGYPNLRPDDLYVPRTNIAIGAEYVADLKDQFGGLYEAIAASYNGGEDNAERWLKRSKPKDPGVFASEVGFAETKHYVYKVMNNYRVYRELYDEDLNRR